MSEPPPPFDPLAALQMLAEAGVEFVVIGGVAARLWGSPTLTRDVDICPARKLDNLDRLAGVLRQLHARLRGVDEDVPFILDARALAAGGDFTFTTDAGDIDLLAVPAGTEGYDDLVASAESLDLGTVAVRVATLDDLLRMKRAAGRPKDKAEVEILSALREERDQRYDR